MASTQSVVHRSEHHLASFRRHLPQVLVLHHRSLHELLPSLVSSLNLSLVSVQLATDLLNDKLSLYRFLKRNRFSIDDALGALSQCISWRLASNIDFISYSSIDPIYLQKPLLFFHPQIHDIWSRPAAILNLKHVCRTEDGGLDGIKDFIAWNLEMARKHLYQSNSSQFNHIFERSSQSSPEVSSTSQPPFIEDQTPVSIALDLVLIVDLKDASMNNLEVELLPYLFDLLKNNFPGMVGQILILNYGWMYAGMWQLAKRILPRQVLDRIFFPTQKELLQFFRPSNLLVEHGGEFAYDFVAQQNYLIRRYGSAPPPAGCVTPSVRESTHVPRSLSVESLHDVFFSAVNTPHPAASSQPGTPGRVGSSPHLHRPSWMSMTAFTPHTHLTLTEFGEAVKLNQLKAGREGCASTKSFQLRLPDHSSLKHTRLEDDDEEDTSQSSSAVASASRSSSIASSSSSNESVTYIHDEDNPLEERCKEGPADHSTSSSQRSLSTLDSRGWCSQEKRRDSVLCKVGTLTPSPRDHIESRRRKRDYWYQMLINFKYFNLRIQMMVKLILECGKLYDRERRQFSRRFFGFSTIIMVLLCRRKISLVHKKDTPEAEHQGFV